MSLVTTLGKLDPVVPLAEPEFAVAVAGLAVGQLHVGSFVSPFAFGILSAPFSAEVDICNEDGSSGCARTMSLRALRRSLKEFSVEDPFTVLVDTPEVASLLRGWQSGSVKPPAWHTPGSNSKTVRHLQRKARELGATMAVRYELSPPPLAEAARDITIFGLRHLRGQLTADELFQECQRTVRNHLLR